MNESPKVVVGVLIYNEKWEIFLARSYKWWDKWVVPWGHLEWGETLEDWVKREVKEEINLDITNIENISVQESIFSQEFHQKKHMVFLNFSALLQWWDIVLNYELQEYRWFNPDESLKENLNSSTREFIEKFIEQKFC